MWYTGIYVLSTWFYTNKVNVQERKRNSIEHTVLQYSLDLKYLSVLLHPEHWAAGYEWRLVDIRESLEPTIRTQQEPNAFIIN